MSAFLSEFNIDIEDIERKNKQINLMALDDKIPFSRQKSSSGKDTRKIDAYIVGKK